VQGCQMVYFQANTPVLVQLWIKFFDIFLTIWYTYIVAIFYLMAIWYILWS
jgi:hypothetical protein